MPDFDIALADRRFAAQFFNDAWGYLDKPSLEPDEADALLQCCHASFHHWTRVADHGDEQLGVGYWQLARAYEKAGLAEGCARYAARCLAVAARNPDKPALAVGAHEVLARAAVLRGDRATRDAELALAREALARVPDPEDRAVYEADLAGVP